MRLVKEYGIIWLVLLIILGWNVFILAQQPSQTCKDTPNRCDKELLLLRGEVDNKRQAIAVLLDANEQWQARAEKAEARVKDLEKAHPPVLSEPQLPATPKD